MNFAQFLQILLARKRIGLGVFTFIVLTTAVISLVLPKRYTAEATLSIEVTAADPVTGLELAGQLMPSYLATQVEIISSHNAALHVVESLGLDKLADAQKKFQEDADGKGDIKDWLAELLLKDLDVKPSHESNVVNIEYTGNDPKFASVLANAFAQAYIRTVIDIRTAGAQQNNAFFQQQIKTLQKSLEEAQQRLADYQQNEGITASDERIDVETQRLNDLSAQYVTAQTQTFDAASRTRGDTDNAPEVLNNPLIQQLKAQLAQKEAAYKELAEREGPNNPRLIEAQSQVNTTRQQLADLTRQYAGGLTSSANSAQARQHSLQQAVATQKARVLELKSQRSKLQILQSGVDNAQKAYDQAMQRYSQTALESHINVANVGFLKSAPEPTKPSKPRVLINLILAIMVGAMMGAGAALLAELRDRRVRSAQDIEEVLGIPVLASLRMATQAAKSNHKRPRRTAAPFGRA